MTDRPARTTANPWLAAVLSFVVPGAGLAYLGMWWWGLINLLVISALGAAAGWVLGDVFWEHAHYAALAFAAGSAGLAHAVALETNRRARQQNPLGKDGHRHPE